MTVVSVRDSSASSTVLPRWGTPRTPERPSYGAAVAAVSEAMGRPLMPHQRHAVDVFLEVQSEAAGDPEPGEWAYDDASWTVQRRGGKTAVIAPVAAHRARLVQRARMFMTAQTRAKARSRWLDVTDDLLSSVLRPDVRRKVGNMNEELRWVETGSLLTPFAPNEEGLHSETPDLVFVDELWAFNAEQARAIKAGYVPAFATSSGQAWKMSTAGTADSVWLAQVRVTGRAAVEAGTRRGVAYIEHGLPDVVNGLRLEELSDAELIQACIDHHPAVCHTPGCPGPRLRRPCPHGFTVRPAAIRSAWVEMDDRAEFVRAYGNRDAEEGAGEWAGVPETTVLRQIDILGIPANAPVCLGVAVDPQSEDAALVAGWRDRAGRMHVELIRREVGTRWVAETVAGVSERQRPALIAVGSTGPARDVADQLEAAGHPVLRVAQADHVAADVRHRDELQAGSWFHSWSPEVEAGAKYAGWSGRWVKGSAPVSAFTAGALAGWAFDHAPPVRPGFWMG